MPDTPTVIVHLYQSRRFVGRQKWRWNARSGNGRIVATSGEAFANFGNCLDSVDLLFSARTDVWLRLPGEEQQLLRMAVEGE